mmetsp:Transcript_1468/g.4780  ORF Transcript_1468/g.4780 Transcript_1468/m.4780 type:complete len:206 (-) Transcript_1468:18-635(-)
MTVGIVLEHTRPQQRLFDLIVGSKLRGVDERISGHVGTQTSPERTQPLLLHDELVRRYRRRVLWRHPGRQLALTLHANLDQVGRACNGDADGSREQSRRNLHPDGITTGNVGAEILDRFIQAYPKTTVNHLALQPWPQPFPQRPCPLLSRDSQTRAEQAFVLGTRRGLLHLEQHLGRVQGQRSNLSRACCDGRTGKGLRKGQIAG